MQSDKSELPFYAEVLSEVTHCSPHIDVPFVELRWSEYYDVINSDTVGAMWLLVSKTNEEEEHPVVSEDEC